MIESIGVSFKEQIKGDQKLIGKNNQLLSDIKIGDVLKGSLTKLGNGQTMLLGEDGTAIPVKLQGMTIFNECISLEVIQKDAGQLLLRLLQDESNILLQNKIIDELDLPETDGMRQLIETFLSQRIPLQREGLLKNYHMSQSLDLPAEVLANLNDKSGGISLQEAKALYTLKTTHLDHALTHISDMISHLKDGTLVKDMYNVLEKYLEPTLSKNTLEMLQDSTVAAKDNMQQNMQHEVANVKEVHVANHKNAILEDISQQEGKMVDQLETSNTINKIQKNNESLVKEQMMQFIKSDQWEEAGKLIKTSLLEALTVNVKNLEQNLEESKHIETAGKLLKNILKVLEASKASEKCEVQLKQLEESVQVINKFNVQGEYYFFPLSLPQGEGKGELYFFKPKKRENGNGKELYVVLALELPQLKNIEIHMRREDEALLLHLKVKEEKALKLIETHLKDLKCLMGQTRFKVDEITVSLIKQKGTESVLYPQQSTLSHMDFKI